MNMCINYICVYVYIICVYYVFGIMNSENIYSIYGKFHSRYTHTLLILDVVFRESSRLLMLYD